MFQRQWLRRKHNDAYIYHNTKNRKVVVELDHRRTAADAVKVAMWEVFDFGRFGSMEAMIDVS
jgi:hypothetical protein